MKIVRRNPFRELEDMTERLNSLDSNVEWLNEASMASEDFSYYLEKVPGCFFCIGNRESI